MLINFLLNDQTIAADLPPGLVLLDFIRYQRQLTGTKIGCREGDCGACTVLIGELHEGLLRYRSVTSCLLPVGNIAGKHIVTIEGINLPAPTLNPVQQAMANESATQCGFCTPGFVMSLAGFCLSGKEPSRGNALAAIDGNICRCTGYKSIERAAFRVADLLSGKKDESPAAFAAQQQILPAYFAGIAEKLAALPATSRPAPSKEAITVGGGTDLYVQRHDSMTHADIRLQPDEVSAKAVYEENGRCTMGAATTVTDLKASPLIHRVFPYFDRYAKLVSSTPIRNMATIAGNLVNASPIGDFTIFLLALDAHLELNNGQQVRTLALRKLYKGYKQLDKKPEEYIDKIWFSIPSAAAFFHFEKVSKRTHLDIASVNSAIALEMDDNLINTAGLSAGGVGPVPMYLEKTSAWLQGRQLDLALAAEAAERVQQEISPISDARGSAGYKRLLLSQLVKIHLTEAMTKAGRQSFA